MARQVVDAFNATQCIDKPVEVNQAAVWNVINDAHAGSKVLVEPWIEGVPFQKFNSNSGWAEGYRAMQALSHFSYDYSHGTYLLCDLQGGCYSNRYLLTDPVIMSNKKEYGPTDLGHTGISNFFAYHQCNYLCADMLLPKRVAKAERFRAVPSTTFLG